MASANAAGSVPLPVKDGFPQIHNEDGSVSEVLAISKHLVGKLIGKGGTTIQQLQATTSTSIQIDQVRWVSCKPDYG
jgi:predicted PilT family ATPase